MTAVSEKLFEIEQRLAADLLQLDYSVDPSIECIYNPIDYASETHQMFLRLYNDDAPKKILFLGMNPGPFGMAQTGVPFGQVELCRDFLKISGDVRKPDPEHPKRPIDGFRCQRNEPSGQRFWSFFRQVCGRPENFAKNCLVYNHCPLVFMSKSGKNLTPPDLKLELRSKIFSACDAALCEVISLFKCEVIIGLGRFAEARAKKIVQENFLRNVRVEFLIHPSPASPAANAGWADLAWKTLSDIIVYDDESVISFLRPEGSNNETKQANPVENIFGGVISESDSLVGFSELNKFESNVSANVLCCEYPVNRRVGNLP